MAVREILLYSEHAAGLRKKSLPVRTANRSVKELVRDLKDTLDAHSDGIGLAAPQINVHRRAVVVRLDTGELGERAKSPAVALINPRIVEARDERKDSDGCLSFPGLYGSTTRPHFLRVAGLDERGKAFTRVFEGFDAVVVHHEIDHLDGVLFIDRIERLEDLYSVQFDAYGHSIRVPISAV
jgi:peptide deformylase